MDFGLGFIQHPSPVLEFQGGLLRVSEEFSQEEPNQRKTLSMGVVIGISAVQNRQRCLCP